MHMYIQVRRKGQKVLVHCTQGVSRSSSFCIADNTCNINTNMYIYMYIYICTFRYDGRVKKC